MNKHLIALLVVLSLGLLVTQANAQQSLSNNSALLTLAPGGSATVGFVVLGTPSPGTAVLVRAVGPTLSNFGIKGAVTSPQFQVFGSDGKPTPYELSQINNTATVIDWNATFSSVGAFALTGGETSFGLFSFPAGTYTAQVSDSSGKGGVVLFEVYINAKYLTVNAQGPS